MVNLVNFKSRYANTNTITNPGDAVLKETFHGTEGWMDEMTCKGYTMGH
jgi:hypothetical protein